MTIELLEDKILLYADSTKGKDIVRVKKYLELRKKLLDELFINHLDEHLSEVADFNDRDFLRKVPISLLFLFVKSWRSDR